MKVYGIKTCGSVKKALNFFKERGVEIEFIDFKKDAPSEEMVKRWFEKVGEKLLNTKGTKYKSLQLKDMNLDKTGKIEWMAKEPLIIKRPVIEIGDEVVVGYDEEYYKSKF